MTQKQRKLHILNLSSSFVSDTDSFLSFIIFKKLYYTGFKLNIVNFSKALPPGPPTEPTEGLTVQPEPQLHFIFQFMQNTELFSFLVNALAI